MATSLKATTCSGLDLVTQAATVLAAALASLPDSHVAVIEQRGDARDVGIDLELHLHWRGRLTVLRVLVKSRLQPREARLAVDDIRQATARGGGGYPVLMAPYISPAVAALCATAEVGYADLAGNCRLSFDHVFIERTGQPNPAPRRNQLQSLFAPRAQRVVRVLLAQPRRAWKLLDLAQEAGVSVGHVHSVKEGLVAQEWAGATDAGLLLTQPAALLEAWAGHRARPVPTVQAFALGSASELEQAVATACDDLGLPYALTEFSAGIRYAPMVRYARATSYVLGDLPEVLGKMKAQQVGTGANLKLVRPCEDGVLYGSRVMDGLRVVSPEQAYVDLMSQAGRGTEAAAAVRERMIEPSW